MSIAAVNSRLAARCGIRQVGVSRTADAAAARADRVIRRQWNALLRALKGQRVGVQLVADHWQAIVGNLVSHARASITRDLSTVAVAGHRSAVKAVAAAVPREVLDGAAEIRINSGKKSAALGESLPLPTDCQLRVHGTLGGNLGFIRDLPLTEADDPSTLLWQSDLPLIPGNLSARDLLQFLFPSPSPAAIDRVVFASDWRERLAAQTRLAKPDVLAAIISQGLAQGRTHQEIARDLRPAVQGVITSARRIARTECLRVAQAVQEHAHRQLGDLVIGYQVHATLDHWTRVWHASRSGTVYFLEPLPSQKGMHQCPHPPDEADDPRERPAGTPHTAPNCRCFLTPVLRDPGDTRQRHEMQRHAAAVIPDMTTYSDWFERISERNRRTAVGVRRYNLVRDRLAGTTSGTLANGTRIDFVQHASNRSGETVIMVDPKKLAAAAPPQTFEEIPGRREQFKQFLQHGVSIQSPRVTMGTDGEPFFIDGRHRFAELRVAGIDRIAITVPKEEAEAFRERFGASQAVSRRRGLKVEKPLWSDFLDADAKQLVPVDVLKRETAEERAARLQAVRKVLAARKADLVATATMGHL